MSSVDHALDDCLSVRDGVLHVEGCAAPELAARFGTPLHVVSEDQLRRNARRFVAAFAPRWPGEFMLLPSIKANSSLALRHVLSDEGTRGEQQRVAREQREQQTRLDEDHDHDADERVRAERLDQVIGVEEAGSEGRQVTGAGQGCGEGGQCEHQTRVRVRLCPHPTGDVKTSHACARLLGESPP